jgi:hypothetical protein
MTTLSEKIVENYTAAEPRVVEVSAWGVTAYIFPETVGQFREIENTPDTVTKALKTLEVRAKNADGSRLFSAHDIEKLGTHGAGIFGPEAVARLALDFISDREGAEVDDMGKG